MKYRPKEFWQKRLSKHFNLAGSGFLSLGQRINEKLYSEKFKDFLFFLEREGLSLKTDVLEIGCGTGFWTEVCRKQGCSSYTGIDIAPISVNVLSRAFGEYTFRNLEVEELSPIGKFPIVLMLDVSQHIVDNEKFFLAMNNIKNVMGTLVVSSWLVNKRKSRYEVGRDMLNWQRAFPYYRFSPIYKFGDKFIFSISE